jgi:pyruvyltransferase
MVPEGIRPVKKLVKLSRYLAARCRPSSAPGVFWHIGTPNFGDDINPAFYGLLSGVTVRLQTARDRPHFLGMGSILEKATAGSVVLGSGFLRRPEAPFPVSARFVAVRGRLSREHIRAEGPVLLGDPMVLLDRVFEPSGGKTHAMGIVPHVAEVSALRRLSPEGVKVIDPADAPWKVIDAIASCERVMSQSLHGLIVADALGIPNLWLAPAASMVGGEFKFLDYFSTLDSAKRPHAATRELLASPPEEFSAGRYLYDKDAYHAALRSALRASAA